MPRLFTALEIPADIALMLARLTAPLPGARWIDKTDYHVTLTFAGDIDNQAAQEFSDQLARIEVDCFSLRLAGLGVFGSSEPRAIWAGVEMRPGLEALARASERAARLAGLKPDKRNFLPHVTLARLKHSRDDAVARFLQSNAGFRTPEFTVERFVLYSSKPSVGGGPYVVEDAFALGGSQWMHEAEQGRW
jgi:2'-5' RNA ligase